ncbi:MAG: stage 0 sporulation protein [Candidatus Omnitrophica bacterium]|nr:stage 0 sporulation protein [Candidatus Omnitrophota bacterium]MDE2008467.1 stage 0 sporulation protein [Candidatus Omnitrophota bacterium]MDE2214805.1 stage 0 sporulation protein [Candidatus Omnitrophota bacterium]MDE2231412.1 stage 0 sporulation protein [Candidatus Omnitrophota bacterium]
MGQLVQIKLGEWRPVIWADSNGVFVRRHDMVVLEVERNMEFGKVISDTAKACSGKTEAAAGRLVRLASDGDLRQVVNNQMKSAEALKTCEMKVAESKIEMQLVQAEYTFDAAKILIYFTAEGRVDFRNLVKDLAKALRVRIELKQIGVRDKAKIIGGYGVCGRELCCSSYMKDFHPLSIKMAKDQGLPLNPQKISGVCGRVKCCMAYEFQVYREFSKVLPKMGAKVTTPNGEKGRIVAMDILKQYVTVDLGEGKLIRVKYPQEPALQSS